MSTRVNAGFDALAIIAALEQRVDGTSAAELHVFAYLACLMAFYERVDPAEWSYGFSATPAGAPFAQALADEADRLRAAGRVVDRGDVLVLSAIGRQELGELRVLRSLSARQRFVEAACACANLLPLPSIADALSYEPQLQLALRRVSSRALMKPAGLTLVEEQFGAIHTALVQRFPDTRDLLVPTVVWLSYLSGSASAERSTD